MGLNWHLIACVRYINSNNRTIKNFASDGDVKKRRSKILDAAATVSKD